MTAGNLLWTFVAATLISVSQATALAAPSAAPLQGVPPTIAIGADETGAAVLAAGLRPGDRLAWTGAHAPLVEPSVLSWRHDADSGEARWSADFAGEGGLKLSLQGASPAPGETAVLAIDRTLDDGTVLQSNRRFIVAEDGVLIAGPSSVARLVRGYRLTLFPGKEAVAGGLECDAEGRVRVNARTPRLATLLAAARRIEPFVAALGTGSVTGSNDGNLTYTPYPCSGPYYGTTVIFSSAPASAAITSTDIS
jgi:hypothetical protein